MQRLNSRKCLRCRWQFLSGRTLSHTTALLALSRDKGQTWTFPAEIFKNPHGTISPDFDSGELEATGCTGKGNESVCIADG